MNKNELQDRTRSFAVRVFKLVEQFPASAASKVVANQLLKSSSSVAANYRAVNRAKSKADFLNKLKVVAEEADESNFWLEFLTDVGILKAERELTELINESNELVAIFTKAIKTTSTKPAEVL